VFCSFLARVPPPVNAVAVNVVTRVSESQAVRIVAAAQASIRRLTATSMVNAGVEVCDVSSHLTMSHCNILSDREDRDGKTWWPALWVWAGATCEVSECVLRGCRKGAWVNGSGSRLQVLSHLMSHAFCLHATCVLCENICRITAICHALAYIAKR
jgi:hypothetical protein